MGSRRAAFSGNTSSTATFSISFFRPLPSELAERNSTKIGHMLGSECDLKTHVRNLRYPLPYKSGAQNHFSTTSQLNSNFNGLYLQNETCELQTTVWVKKIYPLQFAEFFPKRGLEFLIKILHAYDTFTFTLNYNILFSYLQLRQSYAILSTTIQWIFTFHNTSITISTRPNWR